MKFGPVATADAEGALLAHSLRLDGATFRKGQHLSAADIALIAAAGIAEVIVARLEPGDCHEDAAAERLARAVDGGGLRLDPAFTGRVNLFAAEDGLLLVDAPAVNAANRIDPAITLATLPAFARVTRGRMVATAKIIPFAVAEPLVARAEAAARGAVRLAPFRPRKVGLVATQLPHLKPSVLDKTRRITEARLAVSGSTMIGEERVAHDPAAVAAALTALAAQGAEMLLVFGASAIVDRKDVIPAAIEAAGGTVVHFGMPVDPGNLLLVGELSGVPVLGAPGCARSPRENGFDWVLDRLMADLPVRPEDITGLGVGGLLMEIGTRPQPRAAAAAAKAETGGGGSALAHPTPMPRKVAAILLAAGSSTRAGETNKLLARLDGEPLVRIAAEAALASGVSSLTVVTGHMAEAVGAALAGLDLVLAHNPDHADGMASSIRTGIAALPPDADAVLILLADMPGITPEAIDRMIAAYAPEAGKPIVVATAAGKRGNPVLWDRAFFDALTQLEGDVGARALIERYHDQRAEVEIGPPARLDLDTAAELAAAGAKTDGQETAKD
ncbi:NTP transferase domain-containing protein [Stappia indica]|uniref:NTP transferase domain-containing protein n=1 Tax=Stappia indica TaxID=538381 RepID=UPI001CD6A527|nr:molybdopterin-binding/glycosyltransferase family 2 protein [Stappia indica]MCA1299865.1 molybdopterin-binding/glycosyltransferase family 2 protein [Stappia indica]